MELVMGSVLVLAWLYWRRRQAGPVLFALARDRRPSGLVLLGLVWVCRPVLVPVVMYFVDPVMLQSVDYKYALVAFLFQLPIGLAMLLVGWWWWKFEIREKGIWSKGQFFPWAEIDSYEWEGQDILTVRTKENFFSPVLTAIIPPRQHEMVNSQLQRHLH